jgi:steroid delta-isomerase-like uncharacterized protein
MTDSKETLSVARKVFEAFRDHDLDAFRALLADKATLRDPSSGDVRRGPDAIVEALQTVLDAIPDLHPEVETLIASGERAAAEVVRTGTHTGELNLPSGTVPPTGRPVRLPEAIFMTVRDGKLVNMTAYVDQLHVMEEVGLMESKSAETGEAS